MIGPNGNNIGRKSDLITVPFTAGSESSIAYLQTAYYHMHGTPFTYPDYSNPILLTAGAGAWDRTGTIVEIIPAGAILADFDLHWMDVSNISGNGTIKVDIFSGLLGNEVLIGGTKVFRTSNFTQEGQKRIQVAQQPANTRISCRISDSTAGQLTCNIVSFDGHLYV